MEGAFQLESVTFVAFVLMANFYVRFKWNRAFNDDQFFRGYYDNIRFFICAQYAGWDCVCMTSFNVVTGFAIG